MTSYSCPFADPNFEQDIDKPCPVCQALGYFPLRDIEGNSVECIDDCAPYYDWKDYITRSIG